MNIPEYISPEKLTKIYETANPGRNIYTPNMDLKTQEPCQE